MRETQIAYDADENVEYWGKTLATGLYLIKRFYYDASGNMVRIKDDRQGKWTDRANLDWG